MIRTAYWLRSRVILRHTFKRIDHVEIVTDQPERTVQFYTDVLGFEVKFRQRIDRSLLGVPMDLLYVDLGGTHGIHRSSVHR